MGTASSPFTEFYRAEHRCVRDLLLELINVLEADDQVQAEAC